MAGDSPLGFSDRVQNSWFHQLWQVWSCKAVQTIKLPPPCLTVGMMFFLWNAVLILTPDVTGHTPSKKFNFCLIGPQNICLKVLGIIKIFFGKCEMSLCVLFGQQWHLSWNSPMDAVFAQSLSYCWIMNTDLNWGKWGLQFFRCCSRFFYYLLDDSVLCSWLFPATPGKVHHCSKFSPFVDNDCSSLESQSLRNYFITFSKLIHVNYVVFHLFLNFFRSLPVAL